MLFHNFKLSASTGLFSLDDVFGSGREKLLSSIDIAKINNRKKLVKKIGENSPESYAWDLREKAPDIISLYLYVLYKFRCKYFHGNLDPGARDHQDLAKTAFFRLRGLMEATLV